MNSSEGAKEQLHAEAAELRRENHYLRKKLAEHPDDPALRKRAQEIMSRYEQIQRAISAHAGPTAQPVAPAFDIADFDAPASKAPPPVVHKPSRLSWETIKDHMPGARVFRTAIALILLLFLSQFYFLLIYKDMSFFEVPSSSMEPTLLPGDRLVTLAENEYERGDIVVFDDPAAPGEYLVKRVVGVAGDTVEVLDRTLRVNGMTVTEPYLPEPMQYGMQTRTVAPGEVFVLGDNRNHSEDSRTTGRGQPVEAIRGRVVYLYYPAERRGRLRSGKNAFTYVP